MIIHPIGSCDPAAGMKNAFPVSRYAAVTPAVHSARQAGSWQCEQTTRYRLRRHTADTMYS